MLKKSYITSMLLIVMLILAACGTSPEVNDPSVNPEAEEPIENPEENEDETDLEEEEADDTKEENDEDNSNEAEEEEEEKPVNNENDTNEENKTEHNVLENATQVDSEAQDFSMFIFPEYTLTSEEPGRDSLYPTENDNTFMRIETMPFDEETYTYFEENTLSLLDSIKAEEEVKNAASLPQGDDLTNAIGYTVNTDDGVVTGFVFEKDGLVVRLTLFDTADETQFSNFLKMGETIISN